MEREHALWLWQHPQLMGMVLAFNRLQKVKRLSTSYGLSREASALLLKIEGEALPHFYDFTSPLSRLILLPPEALNLVLSYLGLCHYAPDLKFWQRQRYELNFLVASLGEKGPALLNRALSMGALLLGNQRPRPNLSALTNLSSAPTSAPAPASVTASLPAAMQPDASLPAAMQPDASLPAAPLSVAQVLKVGASYLALLEPELTLGDPVLQDAWQHRLQPYLQTAELEADPEAEPEVPPSHKHEAALTLASRAEQDLAPVALTPMTLAPVGVSSGDLAPVGLDKIAQIALSALELYAEDLWTAYFR